MSMVRAFRDMVVVRPDVKQHRVGHVHLPPGSEDEPERGEVISVGPGKVDDKGTFHPTEVSVGQRVVFPRHRGYPLEVLGEACLLMREKDLLGEEVIVQEDAPEVSESTLLDSTTVS